MRWTYKVGGNLIFLFRIEAFLSSAMLIIAKPSLILKFYSQYGVSQVAFPDSIPVGLGVQTGFIPSTLKNQIAREKDSFVSDFHSLRDSTRGVASFHG